MGIKNIDVDTVKRFEALVENGDKPRVAAKKVGISSEMAWRIGAKITNGKNRNEAYNVGCTLPDSQKDFFFCHAGENNCKNCGWNPAVAEKRKAELRNG